MTHPILWLNGAFGVGKTTIATQLAACIPGARIVDPENLGWVIQRTFRRGRDYQEVELWRRLTAIQVGWAAKKGPVIVPMTIVDRGVWGEILTRMCSLRREHMKMIVLTAPRDVLIKRITQSGIATTWRLANLDRCLDAFEDSFFGEHVDTDRQTLGEIAHAIVGRLDCLSRS